MPVNSDIEVEVEITPPASIEATVEIDGELYSYVQLIDKPKINGVELSGDVTVEDLGIERITESDIDELFA